VSEPPFWQRQRPRSKRIAQDAAAALMIEPLLANPFAWPLIVAASASGAAANYLDDCARLLIATPGHRAGVAEPAWSTPNRVTLELQCMRLREFSIGADGAANLVCAPFALHAATIADFAPGHSLIEALHRGGVGRLYVTDWRSASAEMRLLSVDNYLADLNVAVDEIGPPVNLIGLCQGGWMSLIYAARFPNKVRRLALAGAPVDVEAGDSKLSRLASDTPMPIFDELVRLGDGRVLGHHALDLWGDAFAVEDPRLVLQVSPSIDQTKWWALEQRFRAWHAWTVDLPGRYYLQSVSWLYKENCIAHDHFAALGRTVHLADVRIPTFLLAGRDDEVVSASQLFAAARLIGTPGHEIEMMTEPCGHLGLFMGAQTLAAAWPKIAHWLAVPSPPAAPCSRPGHSSVTAQQ